MPKKKCCKKEEIDVERSDDIPCLKSLSLHDKEVSVRPKLPLPTVSQNTKKCCKDVETLDDTPRLTSLQIQAKNTKESCKEEEETDVETLEAASGLPSLKEQADKERKNKDKSIQERKVKKAFQAISDYFGTDGSEKDLLTLSRQSIIEKQKLLKDKQLELRKLKRQAAKRGFAVKGREKESSNSESEGSSTNNPSGI